MAERLGFKRGYVGSSEAVYLARVVAKAPGSVYYTFGFDEEPIPLYFDLDDGGGSSKYVTKDTSFSREEFLRLVGELKALIKTEVESKHSVNLDDKDFIVHDSFKSVTNSVHLFVPAVCFRNAAALSNFIAELLVKDPSGRFARVIDIRSYSQVSFLFPPSPYSLSLHMKSLFFSL